MALVGKEGEAPEDQGHCLEIPLPLERVWSEFDFISRGERERFCAYVRLLQAAAPTSTITLAAPIPPLPPLAPADAASNPPPPALGGTIINHPGRPGVRTPSVALPPTLDGATAFARSWPLDDVRVWVGTYNIGGKGPPSPEDLSLWLPRPSHRAHPTTEVRATSHNVELDSTETVDAKGRPSSTSQDFSESEAASSQNMATKIMQYGPAHDMYVVGFQEMGSGANREAWIRAILSHLNGGIDIPSAQRLRGRSRTVSTNQRPDASESTDLGNTREKRTDSSSSLHDKEFNVYNGMKAALMRAGTESTLAPRLPCLYEVVAGRHMWEMGVWIFVATRHVADISNVTMSDVPTGIGLAKQVTGKQLGNKGGVGVSLQWRDVPMAFIVSHLAARPERIRQRMENYTAIVQRLGLSPLANVDVLHAHDHVFWLGDLNYRVELPFDEALEGVRNRDWRKLAAHDQLLGELTKGSVLSQFKEPKIDFPPSYRWSKTSQVLSNKRGQAPSYTDRIFYR